MRVLKILGFIIFYGCGLYLYIVGLIFYYALWDIWGLIIMAIVFPAAEIFPIVVWIVTKEFPLFLFIIWFSGWAGMILVGIASRKDDIE